MTFLAFDKKALTKDTLSAISRFGDGKKFVGHDGREYALVSGDKKPESKNFFDVAVNIDGEGKAVARYVIVLIRISSQ